MTNNLLGMAIAIASEVHEKQFDKGGNAYILHPLRLMFRLRTDDVELMQIAVLHDVVEDSNGLYTIEKLYKLGFSKRVCDALTLLTHNPNDSYEQYVRMIASNIDAIMVKMKDLHDNGDFTRLKGLRTKDFERMAKYQRAYAFLKDALANIRNVGYCG